jgi:hypothetical protein
MERYLQSLGSKHLQHLKSVLDPDEDGSNWRQPLAQLSRTMLLLELVDSGMQLCAAPPAIPSSFFRSTRTLRKELEG